MKKIGVFGGSFNPPHYGHLIVASYIFNELALDSILFVPTYIRPIDPEKVNVPFDKRAEMTRLAVENDRRFEISLIEGISGKLTYSVELLQLLTEQLRGAKLYFLMGADCLEEIKLWYHWQDLWRLANVVISRRVGIQAQYIKSLLPTEIYEKTIFSSAPIIELSSSMIRERVKQGLSIKYMLPEAIEKYIRLNRLYR